MARFDDLTVSEIKESLARYQPYLLLLLGIVLLAAVLPGDREDDPAEDEVAAVNTGPASLAPTTTLEGVTDAVDPSGAPLDTTGGAGTVGGGRTPGRQAGAQAGPTAGTTSGTGTPTHGGVTAGVATQGDPNAAPDCDTARGRIKIPSIYAPNCVGVFSGDNGGATYRGVTGDTITIAIYETELSESAQAIAAAGGATDETSDEEDDANRNLVIKAYEAHFETYGRTVKWVKVPASGPEDDDAAAKADAIEVATKVKAFASFGGPTGTNAYANELAARGVLCFCTASQPIENYLAWAPYVWSGLMSSSQGYIHRSEYVCKRLKGKPAKFAGSAAFKTRTRTFALVYYDTADQAYKAGADFMEKKLAECGVKLGLRLATKGAHIDTTGAQDEARIYAAKLADAEITSVLFAGDPFYPIFLTQESTNQQYDPEWIITGSTLSDTAFFARLYDQRQWRNAFGISFLTARVDTEISDPEFVVNWHYGQELASYPNITDLSRLYTGVHLAGPKLTPETFRDGLFSFKPTKNFITQFAVSYGRGLWPWDDYLAADDTTEIWWDPVATGESETGTQGTGLYRYVDGGKRYLPGEWPSTDPKAFDPAGTSLIYPDRPPQDRAPEYPHDPNHVRSSPAHK